MLKNIITIRHLLASGFFLLPENLNDFCDEIRLIIQNKEGGNDSFKVDEEMLAIIDKLLHYKCNSTTQLKNILISFKLI